MDSHRVPEAVLRAVDQELTRVEAPIAVAVQRAAVRAQEPAWIRMAPPAVQRPAVLTREPVWARWARPAPRVPVWVPARVRSVVPCRVRRAPTLRAAPGSAG